MLKVPPIESQQQKNKKQAEIANNPVLSISLHHTVREIVTATKGTITNCILKNKSQVLLF